MSDAPGDESPLLSRRGAIGGLVAAAGLVACSGPSRSTTKPGPTSAAPAPKPTPSQTQTTTRATEIVHGPRTGTNVALTFHGAGDVSLARKLLDEAEGAGAKLTILAVGTWLEAEPTIARRILDGGHELGNHTWHHVPMRDLSAARTREEITHCAEQLRTSTGTIGKWFRPSGIPRATARILTAAAAAGYQHSLAYDVDPRDYQDPGADVIVSRFKAEVQPGSIVSLHLGHAGTVQALPRLLDVLQSKKLTPVTVSALLA